VRVSAGFSGMRLRTAAAGTACKSQADSGYCGWNWWKQQKPQRETAYYWKKL